MYAGAFFGSVATSSAAPARAWTLTSSGGSVPLCISIRRSASPAANTARNP